MGGSDPAAGLLNLFDVWLALAAAFLLAADPATAAKSNGGILLAAAAGGVMAFFSRYYGAEPYGAIFAVIFVNAILPLVRIFENRKLYEKRKVPQKSRRYS